VLETTGSGGSFTATDHDPVGTFSYQIQLTATDSSGLTNTQTILLPFQHTGSVTCSPASPGAAVCTLAAGATVPAPVHFTGAATPNPGYRISAIYALFDNVVIQKFLNVASFSLDLNLAPGPHSLRVQAWDTSGALFKPSAINITVTMPCTLSAPGAAVCTPAAGATVPAPVHFTGAATPNPGYRISAIYALFDNVVIQKFLNVASFSLDLNLAPGPHSLRVQAWDTSGALFKPSAINITVTMPCTLSAPGAIICTPANGQTVSSPAHLSAKAQPNSGYVIEAIWVYLDNILVSQSSRMSSIDTNVTVPSGAHNLRIQAWDTSGALFMSGVNITVP
jgi:hypothetical protein